MRSKPWVLIHGHRSPESCVGNWERTGVDPQLVRVWPRSLRKKECKGGRSTWPYGISTSTEVIEVRCRGWNATKDCLQETRFRMCYRYRDRNKLTWTGHCWCPIQWATLFLDSEKISMLISKDVSLSASLILIPKSIGCKCETESLKRSHGQN